MADISKIKNPDGNTYNVKDSTARDHIANKDNPHGVTKAQVGLGNVDNTADKDKSVKYATSASSADKLTTSRTLTIGNTGKSFDGSANISWSLSEIGALPVNGNAGTVNGHTVNSDVPAGAVFTDHTYSAGDGLVLNGTEFKTRLNSRITIDLSDSKYDQNKWYPVVGTALPYTGLAWLRVACQLNTEAAVTWSSHNSGTFTANLEILTKASGWGTTNSSTIVLDYSWGWTKDGVCPVSYLQMNNSSAPVFYLRGGGRYYVYASYDAKFTVYTSAYTASDQTVDVQSSCPSIDFNYSTVYANLAGTADAANNVAWEHTNHPATFPPSAHNHDSTYLKLSGGTMSGQLLTSFKNSVATGSYQAAASTVPDLIQEVRYSSGCMGSANLTTAYNDIPAAWYNFLYIPHRSGGVNGAVSGDNCDYGTLLLFGMTTSNQAWIVEFQEGNIKDFFSIRNTDTNTTYGVATSSADGLMSKSDKAKLDGIGTGSNVKSVNGKTGAVTLAKGDVGLGSVANLDQSKAIKSITRSGTTFTATALDGTTTTFTQQDTNTTYGVATSSADGLMSKSDKAKLDGIAAGAEKNAITGVKGSSEPSYRTGNVNITKANIGLGNVDNTADANKSVKSATSAAKDSSGQQINTTYIKELSALGRTITATKGNGSKSIFNIAGDDLYLFYRGVAVGDLNEITTTGIYYVMSGGLANTGPSNIDITYCYLIVIGFAALKQQFILKPDSGMILMRSYLGQHTVISEDDTLLDENSDPILDEKGNTLIGTFKTPSAVAKNSSSVWSRWYKINGIGV